MRKCKGNGDHFALVVGYINEGNELSDFIVIDPHSELGLLGQTVRIGASNYNMHNFFMRYNNYFHSPIGEDERGRTIWRRNIYFRTLTFKIE
jgi:hypothetical protein